MSKNRINVFIPHYGKDEEHIPKLKKLIESKGYSVSDSSIVETNPNNATNTEYIKTLLRPKIDRAGTVLVLIGPKTHERDWVNWEIDYAFRHGKRIVGVFIQGATDADLPESFKDYGDACVAWNSDKLIAAIEGEDIWHDSTGNDRPIDGSGRVTC
ncbi:TIR domain-containing protein [Paenibacillus sp. FSL R10-2199]|uniref:TIR domain-containing protein n=1 Tax=Paenibacillus sp. FSL R10-2199 TaxID=2975348 RepID=UPI0030F99C91